ncbi:MAG: DUF1343 domain-containing protein [Chloroflexota bacterium]|nr:DUF1343 domain-containing protein [Chloroflexota bacterium]
MAPAVETGLAVLLAEGHPALEGRRLGLLTNPTGVDCRLRSTVDLLLADPRFRLVALFGPEHGVRGDAQAGEAVASGTDPRTGLPAYSLYGRTRRPTPAMLSGLDALVVDLQDVGVRYATYASTTILAQEAAAEASIPLVILDRPNPLGGERIEGGLLGPAWESFVGAHPVPVRHGLTLGELAQLVAAERGWPEPVVVPLRGWQRGWWFDETGLPWVQPSPNLPTLDALTLYPGTCLLEGTNLPEGRGTTRPFELVGAPWLDPHAFAEELSRRDVPGLVARPAYFVSTFSKHAGVRCGGVQLHVVDREALRPVALGLHLLDAVRRLDPGAFDWVVDEVGRRFVDVLLGGDEPRTALETGADVERIESQWEGEAAAFGERRRLFLLYG